MSTPVSPNINSLGNSNSLISHFNNMQIRDNNAPNLPTLTPQQIINIKLLEIVSENLHHSNARPLSCLNKQLFYSDTVNNRRFYASIASKAQFKAAKIQDFLLLGARAGGASESEAKKFSDLMEKSPGATGGFKEVLIELIFTEMVSGFSRDELSYVTELAVSPAGKSMSVKAPAFMQSIMGNVGQHIDLKFQNDFIRFCTEMANGKQPQVEVEEVNSATQEPELTFTIPSVDTRENRIAFAMHHTREMFKMISFKQSYAQMQRSMNQNNPLEIRNALDIYLSSPSYSALIDSTFDLMKLGTVEGMVNNFSLEEIKLMYTSSFTELGKKVAQKNQILMHEAIGKIWVLAAKFIIDLMKTDKTEIKENIIYSK